MRGRVWLRFLEWRFRKFHTHRFYPSGVQLAMGPETWQRLNCTHCEAHTWDIVERENREP